MNEWCRYSLLRNELARFLAAAVAVRTPASVFCCVVERCALIKEVRGEMTFKGRVKYY